VSARLEVPRSSSSPSPAVLPPLACSQSVADTINTTAQNKSFLDDERVLMKNDALPTSLSIKESSFTQKTGAALLCLFLFLFNEKRNKTYC
jgi:hypothetical protein